MATAMSGLAWFQEQQANKPLPSTILVRSGQSGISVCQTYWIEPALNHFRLTTPIESY